MGTLKNMGGQYSIDWIAKAFSDESALLKHEVAYCLGQLQDPLAIPILSSVLEDPKREPIVRHEDAEALAAIGGETVLAILEKHKDDEGVDPAPASNEQDVEKLKTILNNTEISLFERYKAMFALRNIGDEISIKALASGLNDSSALFRHEVAFVLGQVASPHAVAELTTRLRDDLESPMVRHECAEALGSIATPGLGVEDELSKYLSKETPAVVRESCEIALNMADYNNSEEFQYAHALA